MMQGLTEGYRLALADNREPLILVPLAVLDFLCIHPFSDGNGRVARLLTLQLLYHFDYEVGRYISLERIIEESKETYYEALEASSQGWSEGCHDVFPWMRYLWGVLLRAYREFEERVGTIRSGRGSKTDRVVEAVARRIGPFSISDIEADCPGVTRDWIRVVLRRLRDDGTIVPRGKGRGARWVKREV
jgi:Fic family protein